MRTQEEIVTRIEERKEDDMLGFEWTEYLNYLDYEHVKQFLKPDTKKKDWTWGPRKSPSPKSVMVDYMPFAWEKANNFRGISAMRSLSHYTAWLWLDGADELASSLGQYEFYGKPHLCTICKYLGLDADKWDDGVRANKEYD